MAMKQGVLIEPKFDPSRATTKVVYETNPYQIAQGLLRVVQRFSVVLLTTKGSDNVRPWFGTYLSSVPQMNIGQKGELELFIRDQVKNAKDQFFTMQSAEMDTLSPDDILRDVVVQEVTIYPPNIVVIKLLFTAATQEALSTSLTV